MKKIILNSSNIESKTMEVEFINWLCPTCKTPNRDIEFSLRPGQPLICKECFKPTEYTFEKGKQSA